MRPNVLLISCDQLRFDAVGAHGNPVVRTPNLDRLIAAGTSFRRAYTESPVCVPSRSILLTGKLPHRTGVVANRTPLPRDALTFIHLLRRRGYLGQAIGKMHFRPVRSGHGLDRMWLCEEVPRRVEGDDYLRDLIAAGYGHVLEPHGVRHELYYSPQPSQLPEHLTGTAWIGRRTVEFLEERAERPEQPFFCWTSFIKPHPPFDPPAPWYLMYDPLEMPDPVRSAAERSWAPHPLRRSPRANWHERDLEVTRVRVLRAWYYALVSHVDHWVGRIVATLDRLGLRRRTLLLLVADHGDHLGDHWALGKGTFHDSAARLPLVASWLGTLPEGRTVDALVGHEDLAPTILAAAGIDPAPLAADGHDLGQLASGAVASVRDHLLGQAFQGEHGIYLAMDRHHKYLYSAADDRELLFRVGSHQDETADLAGDPAHAPVVAALRSRLIERFRRDGYTAPLEGAGWRRRAGAVPPPGAVPLPGAVGPDDPHDRRPEGRNRQYPLWPGPGASRDLPAAAAVGSVPLWGTSTRRRSMRYARLGNTDLEVSVVALGCGNFEGIGSPPELLGKGDDEETAFALMDAARELGITLFDTANSYALGGSEEMIGRWLASRGARDEIVLSTKVRSRVGPRPQDEGLSARHIREQIEASLRRLGTDHVDLYLAHAPDPSVPLEETLAAFDELVRAGKVRHAGLSNYSGIEVAEAVRLAAGAGLAAPACLQNEYSLLVRQHGAGAFPVCAEHGIGFTAYSPLAGGWLTGKYRAGRAYPEGSRMTLRPDPYRDLERPATYAAVEALEGIAAARGVDLTTLALAWIVSDPGVTSVIVGPRTPAQLDPAMAALDLELGAADRAELTELATAPAATPDGLH